MFLPAAYSELHICIIKEKAPCGALFCKVRRKAGHFIKYIYSTLSVLSASVGTSGTFLGSMTTA